MTSGHNNNNNDNRVPRRVEEDEISNANASKWETKTTSSGGEVYGEDCVVNIFRLLFV